MKKFVFIAAAVVVLVATAIFFLNRQKPKEIIPAPEAVQEEEITLAKEPIPSPIKKAPVKQEPAEPAEPAPLAEKSAAAALIQNLSGEDALARQKAQETLIAMGKEAMPALLAALSDETASVELKTAVIFILGRIKDPSSVPAVIEMLKNDAVYVRMEAAQALANIGDKQATFDLGNQLLDDTLEVRQSAAWALGELKDTAGADSLLNRFRDESESSVRSAIVDSLGKLGDRRATDALLGEFNASDDDSMYKNSIVIALGNIADPQALDTLTAYAQQLRELVQGLKQAEQTAPPAEGAVDESNAILVSQYENFLESTEDAIAKIKGM